MVRSIPTRRPCRRRGMAMLEVVLALTALAIVGVSIVQAMVGLDRTRQATEQIDLASRELENLLTDFAARPYDQITTASATALALPAEAATQLAGATLNTTVEELTGPIGKRITARLTLAGPGRAKPLSLTVWVFAPPAEPDEEDAT